MKTRALVVSAVILCGMLGWSALGQTVWTKGHSSSLLGDPHPKLETTLQWLAERYEASPTEAQSLAGDRGIRLIDDAAVLVIEPVDGRADLVDLDRLEQYGGQVEASSAQLLRVRIPLDQLLSYADAASAAAYLRLPYEPRSLAVVSEGVGLTGAPEYHGAGYYGQGVDVAVIDLGFGSLSAAQGAGELASVSGTQDYTATGLQTGTIHGTMVAELVEDMAPQAALHLLKIADEVDLALAVTYCISNGIDVIVHAVGWYNTCYYDGQGVVGGEVERAKQSGILWVNAAGNGGADGHWQGRSDVDLDGSLDYGPGADYLDTPTPDGWDEGINVTIPAGETLNVYATWDDWDHRPGFGSNQDYDLLLVNSSKSVVASSGNAQTGTQEPKESFTYSVAGTYELFIVDLDGPDGVYPDVEVFAFTTPSLADTAFQYHQATSSILTPANSADAVAVGSMDHSSWTTGPIEPTSAHGPSNSSVQQPTSLTKPDIVGPDRVATYAGANAGVPEFAGTSAAAPHVAGAAALLLSQDPALTADQLQTLLEGSSIDMGSAGKDNTYGAGRLRLPPPSTEAVFRVTTEGDVLADGTVFSDHVACGAADVAEWVPVSELVEPGDVLMLDAERPGVYRLSAGPWGDRVAGVVSTAPGVELGGGLSTEQRALLALVGIVPVKVTNEAGAIQIGDLLVTSSTPGRAMRWSGVEPCPYALVGKALEPMAEESGTVLALLTAH